MLLFNIIRTKYETYKPVCYCTFGNDFGLDITQTNFIFPNYDIVCADLDTIIAIRNIKCIFAFHKSLLQLSFHIHVEKLLPNDIIIIIIWFWISNLDVSTGWWWSNLSSYPQLRNATLASAHEQFQATLPPMHSQWWQAFPRRLRGRMLPGNSMERTNQRMDNLSWGLVDIIIAIIDWFRDDRVKNKWRLATNKRNSIYPSRHPV